MEKLGRLQECNKGNITFKQAFFKMGIVEEEKPMKELNEKEEFSALANWILNKLEPFQGMDLRFKADNKLYQTTIHKSGRRMGIGKSEVKADFPGAITYDWPEGITYDKLEVDIITKSMLRADIINFAKKEGKMLSRKEIEEIENPQINWTEEESVAITQIKLVQTDTNCRNVVLTEEERNIISEFLEV